MFRQASAILTKNMNLKFLLLALIPVLYGQAENKKNVLLIGHNLDHPFGTHMYLHECNLLAKCLNQNPGVSAVVSNGWPSDPDMLNNVDALVFYSSPAAEILLDKKNKEQSQSLFEKGIGYTAIHWATGSNLKNGPQYELLLGGWFNFKFSGINIDKQRLVQINPKHPICNGWSEYDLQDEFYLRMKLSDNANPLIKVKTKGKEEVVAWTLEREGRIKGRSFGITLGHFHPNYGIESFRKTIVNGILWTAKVSIPKTGAKVKIDPIKDMKLSPNLRK
jgi:type 1 glutamine amidotransferase|tara:strand:+ start:1099 stop:1929 length:831 start_codon:yes stop_codon:yes gene_type:complete